MVCRIFWSAYFGQSAAPACQTVSAHSIVLRSVRIGWPASRCHCIGCWAILKGRVPKFNRVSLRSEFEE
jgi:hypothetical protein